MSCDSANLADATGRQKPLARGGLLHILDAAGYSMAGLRRLLQEAAARLELAGIALGCLLFGICGADMTDWIVFAGLSVAVLVVEALNTALEVLTDRISPEWSIEAKQAKDLGSAAVALTLMATCGWVAKASFGL
ncbi:diacylglycerol kinase [Pseudogemmobacter humi]|uniref:Diacylglycerol kinase n=1 Tax=Pseudogemmobacter humi TaxID=2483812 RepID=A0A3P5XGK3_9RHOB|nr:diacylglycerol kinase [Pseudogemmobacter humi]VDC33878.1 Diacylglycerol kinase [Pseudogemmobacter humi]